MPVKAGKQGSYIHLYVICALLTLAGFFIASPGDVIGGFVHILLSPGNLITDYIDVGGLGAAFFNSGIIGLASVFLLHRSRVKHNGAAIAGVFTVCGFAFFGKTIYNSLPVTVGVYLYSLFKKRPFSEVAVTSLFATAIAPLVSMLSFGMGLAVWKGVLIGCAGGVFIGFIIAPLADSFFSFHKGFSLYNTGFATGIAGMCATGVLRMFNLQVNTVSIISSGNNLLLSIMLLCLFTAIFIAGLYFNNWSFKNYLRLIKCSGRLKTDFIEKCGYGTALINMAIMGLISWSYIIIIGGEINGASLGALFTIMGFAAYGKHPLNTIPVFLGAIAASWLNMYDHSSTVVVIAVLFGSTLAPIAGRFGFIAGVVAGFVHVSMTLNVGYLHGGMNLYNNGFAGGFVAAIMSSLLLMIAERINWKKGLEDDCE